MATTIPLAKFAVFDILKLSNYCVSNIHPVGKHKAKLFKASLGIGVGDAAWLQKEIYFGFKLLKQRSKI